MLLLFKFCCVYPPCMNNSLYNYLCQKMNTRVSRTDLEGSARYTVMHFTNFHIFTFCKTDSCQIFWKEKVISSVFRGDLLLYSVYFRRQWLWFQNKQFTQPKRQHLNNLHGIWWANAGCWWTIIWTHVRMSVHMKFWRFLWSTDILSVKSLNGSRCFSFLFWNTSSFWMVPV